MQSLWRSLAKISTCGERIASNISHQSVAYSKHHGFSLISEIADTKLLYQPVVALSNNILDKAVDSVRASREIPDIKPGYIIQLKVEVPENKRRVSALKGIVIARRNASLNTTIRLRRMVAGVGVESVFPLWLTRKKLEELSYIISGTG